MKEKVPVSKKAQKQEESIERGAFVACGRRSSLGGFDPFGYLPGRNPEGSDCVDGWRSWWSHTVLDLKTGRAIHSDEFVLVTAECRCRKRWKAGRPLIEGKSPQAALLSDSKAKAAGE